MKGFATGLLDQEVQDTVVFLLADHIHHLPGQWMIRVRHDHAVLRNPGIMALLPTMAR